MKAIICDICKQGAASIGGAIECQAELEFELPATNVYMPMVATINFPSVVQVCKACVEKHLTVVPRKVTVTGPSKEVFDRESKKS